MKQFRLVIALNLFVVFASFFAAYHFVLFFFLVPLAFKKVAMGTQTTTVDSRDSNGFLVHARHAAAIEEMYNGWIQRGKRDVVLLVSNSQWHCINQIKENDKLASNILFNMFDESHGIDVLSYSFPNINLQGMEFILSSMIDVLPVKVVCIATFLDDMREDGLTVRFPLSINGSSEKPSDKAIANERLNLLDEVMCSSALRYFSYLSKLSLQQKVDKYLSKCLYKRYKVWIRRPMLRGKLALGLYRLRNYVFKLNAQSSRKIIKGPYVKNMNSFINILKESNENAIKFNVYIPPIRQDYKIPYELKQYKKYKSTIRSMCSSYGANYYDLDSTVPAEFWGTKIGTGMDGGVEVDYMHFQGRGHEIISEHLTNIIEGSVA